jgi:hypothetical protein
VTDDTPFEPSEPAVDDGGAEPRRCPSCLGTVAADQVYCLQCGYRVGEPGVRSTGRLGTALTGASSRTLTLIAAGALAVGLLIAWGVTRDSGTHRAGTRSGTHRGSVSDVSGSDGGTIGSTEDTSTDVTDDTSTDGVDTSVDPSTDTSTDTTATAPDAASDDWPDGQSSWAVVLYSKPNTEFGWDHFITQKDEAVAAGISDAGLLASDNYPSLVPAIYVLFRGPLGSRQEAIDAAVAAQASYPGAYARWISESEATPP